ncbi:MAG TPA: ornithine cyclodeaminase family protein [Alphaproteobacteria bacterium]|nr:ornithine cyclodeaminase family protein [Alphaproteobacteria bacterium]
MRMIAAAEVEAALDETTLIEALRAMFREDCATPVRTHHTVAVPGAPDATLLFMPAWQSGREIGVKLVTVHPGNADRGKPSVQGIYVLIDATTGNVLALMDAPTLTVKRTACASALAATYLARADAARLLVLGTGALAPHLVRAHAAARPIRSVRIWGRNPAKSEALARRLAQSGLAVEAATDLEAAVAEADIVSCATMTHEPLVHGAWLRPGQHLDLVGGYTPAMREADDEAVRRARVFVDTRAGATKEAGDIVQPLQSGVLREAAIQGDLYELCRGARPGRQGPGEITFFKSVGAALEDLAAARLVLDKSGGPTAA